MKKATLLRNCALAGALICGGLALAQRPAANIDAKRHSNLAAAQQHIIQAYDALKTAQEENKDKLGGHAEKAIQLLEQVDKEVKLAAEYANHGK